MKKILILLMLSFLCASVSASDLRLAGIFSDNMVLQQQTNAPIWGWAEKGAKVTIVTSWDGKKYTCTAGEDGKWKTELSTPSAGGPYTIKLAAKKEKLELSNVMIGEVWMCSGQSNMEMPIKSYNGQPLEGGMDAILEANVYAENIRVYRIYSDKAQEPVDDLSYSWEYASPEVTANTSALAYFFAKKLSKALGVPVGIITGPWGGGRIEPWMTMEYFESCKEYMSKETYEYILTLRDTPDQVWQSPWQISTMYNSRIHPIEGYALKGFLWYQGCSNLWQYDHYDKLQKAMVQCWRDKWGDTDNQLAFFFTTLAPYGYEAPSKLDRALFVENQLSSLELIPNSGAAITESIGDETCIHPARKQEIADQMTLLALENTYGIKTEICGFPYPSSVTFPAFSSVEVGTIHKASHDIKIAKNDKDEPIIAIYFANAPMGIGRYSYNGTKVKGFEVAGTDKVFHTVEATIWFDHVDLDCSGIADPIAVRYAFHNYCESDLFTPNGIPVPAFRTDSW